MNEGLIPRRYAKALYKVAVERGDDCELYDLMNRLVTTADAQPGLSQAISNPFVSDSDKIALLTTAAAAENDKTFADFLKLLAQNSRLDMTLLIARQYADLYRHERNIYKVDVVSASPLDSAEEDRLKRMINSHLNGGSMEYVSRVDPDLIGGFTVSIDNERLDASVRNELKQLRLNLLK